MEKPKIIQNRVHTMCRTCLENLFEGNEYNIFLIPNLLKWLSVCTSLVIEEDDKYPKYLCNVCYQKIQQFYEFREMCLNSIEIYKDIELGEDIHFVEKENNLQNEKEKFENKSLCLNENSNEMKFVNDETIDVSCADKNVMNEANDKLIDKSKQKQEKKKHKEFKKIKKLPKSDDKTISKIFACGVCNKRFLKNEKYEAHMRTHAGLKPWECSQCNKQYNKRHSLEFHIKYEHGPKEEIDNYICTYDGCGKSYKHNETLRAHIRNTHTSNGKGKISYICEECGKSMTSLAGLKRHRLTHSGEFPFKCDICSKCFRTKSKLSEHMKRHTGIKNYICSVCGLKKFSQHELNVHMNFHTKEKQSKCAYCPYTSGNIGNVRRHEKIVHHGIKPFICKYCGNCFGKLETLKHHEMTHTGEKPHKCDICDRRFIQLTALKTHLKRHEKNTTRINSNKSRTNSQQQQQEEKQQQSQQLSTIPAIPL